MKTVYTFITLFILTFGFSQNGKLTGHVILTDDGSEIPGLKIEVIKDGKSMYDIQTDFHGNYTLKDIPFGTYNLKMSLLGYRDEIIDNLVIDMEVKTVNLSFPKPCNSNEKICPKGHKDKIIPIVYGFPNKKMMKKAKNGKVKLGGCTPYCEKWHCTKHDLNY